MSMPELKVDGKVSVVTGAGSGLGKAFAIALAIAGSNVAITELPGKEELGQETVKEIEKKGCKGNIYSLDVRDILNIQNVAKDIISDFGKIDILVNNAGINISKPMFEITEEDWDKVLDTNLKGVFFCSQVISSYMIEQGGGKIINISSQNGIIGYYKRAPYCASKGGVINLTRELAIELAPYNINVNSVAPTFVMTPLTQKMFEDNSFYNDVINRIPMGRLANPEDISGAIVYLASSAADMITGHTLVVDGGWTAI